MIVIASLCANATNVAASESPKFSEKKPTIVALAPHIVELLFDIGAGKQIIGTTEFSNYPEQAKKIPRIGNYVRLQIERIIELQPDIIIAWKSGSPSDDLDRLKQLGFTIIYSQPNSFADIAKEVEYFAQLTGHQTQGKILARQFMALFNDIKKEYQNKLPITVFYELWSQPLTTIAKGSWPQQYLDICRANNPFRSVATPYPQVNIEQVLQKPIQLIIQPMSTSQNEKLAYNWQKWTSIEAIKNKQLIQPDADEMHRMTLRSIDALSDLCLTIDKTREFYFNLNKDN